MSLYDTAGAADIVDASSASSSSTAPRRRSSGGGDFVMTTSPSALTLSGTNGDWDAVLGSDDTIAVENAEAAILGGGDAIVASAGSWLSLYNTGARADSVEATGAYGHSQQARPRLLRAAATPSWPMARAC